MENGALIDLATVDLTTIQTRFAKVTRPDGTTDLVLNFENSPKWPSVEFTAPGGAWDLTGYAGIEIQVTNESAVPVLTFAYIANPEAGGEKKRSSEKQEIPAGATVSMKIIFGQSPTGTPAYALDPSQVELLRIFVAKVNQPVSLKLTGVKVFRGEN